MPADRFFEGADRTGGESVRATAIDPSLIHELYATIEGLRNGNVLLRRLFDANVIGILLGPFGVTIQDANEIALRSLGHSREDLNGSGLSWQTLVPEHSMQTLRMAVDQLDAVGFSMPFEIDLRRGDGEVLHALVGAAQLEGTDRVVSFLLDLTEQRQAERALRENERRMRAIVAAIPDMIFRIDATGVIVDSPSAACPAHPIPPGELIGRDLGAIFPHDVAAGALHYVREALRTGSLQVFEYALDVDGSMSHFEARIVTCGSDEVMAIVRNVTEHKEAEEALRASALRFRSLIEKSWDAVALLDSRRRIIYASPAVTRIFGYTPEEILDLDPFAIIHPDDRERMEASFAELTSMPGGSLTGQYRQRRADGNWVWIEGTGTNLIHEPAVNAVVVNFRDITEQKMTELEAGRAREAAEAANLAKDQFLAILSHELRTPLAPVMAAVQLMETEPGLSEDIRSCVDIIHRNIDVEVRLIDDLLDLTRIARGKIELNRKTVDAHDLLRKTMEVVDADIRGKKIRMAVDLEADRHIVDADPARLQQVFWNIIKNAIKFTPEGGEVTVRSRTDQEGWLVAEVSDTGIGIDAEHMARIFNPFDQGEQSITKRFGGLGLGLAISKTLVEMHGGAVVAFSEGEGRGATFTVRLATV